MAITSAPDSTAPAGAHGKRPFMQSRLILLIAFAFAVMGDPVSSVAYAIEAGLRALHGDLGLLIATMAVVVVIIALVDINYHQLIGRFPHGGGSAAAAAGAFGDGWAFLPLGALIVDYALTIAISVAAGSSAIIAYAPALAHDRVPMALLLTVLVAGLTWFGHGGRTLFAAMTITFVAIAVAVLLHGFLHPVAVSAVVPLTPGAHPFAPLAVLLAFPVGMALATGTEAPSSAIAQLGQLDDRGRMEFGRITIWLTLGIVAVLTLGLTVLAVRLHVGIPPENSTQVAMIAADAVGKNGLFAAFQITSTLMLLSAANSSFNAGPGLLKALARQSAGDGGLGILPHWLARTNPHHTPYWGVVVFLAVSGGLVVAAGGHDQVLVLFYAVAVFLSFLFGLLAMARFSWRDRKPWMVAVNGAGALLVALTLGVDVARIYPIASLLAAAAIGGLFYLLWVRAGKPTGVSQMEGLAEADRDGVA